MSDSKYIVEFQTDIGTIRVRVVQHSLTALYFMASARKGELDGVYEAFTRSPQLRLRPRNRGRIPQIDHTELSTECPPDSCFIRTDGIICFSFNRSGYDGVILGKIISDTGVLDRLRERKMSAVSPYEFKGFNSSERVKTIRVTEVATQEVAAPQTQHEGQGVGDSAAPPAARFCSNCGHALESGARFCAGCGTAVAGQAAPVQARPAATPPPAIAAATETLEIEFEHAPGVALRAQLISSLVGAGSVRKYRMFGRVVSAGREAGVIEFGTVIVNEGTYSAELMHGTDRAEASKLLNQARAHLLSQGWKESGRGREWYSLRFER